MIGQIQMPCGRWALHDVPHPFALSVQISLSGSRLVSGDLE